MRLLLQKLWSLRREFAKYFVIGVSAYTLDVGSLGILKHYFGVNPTLAVVLNQPPILLFVFFLNKYWSFQVTGMTHRQLVRFLTVALMNYCIAITWMWFFTYFLHVDAIITRLIPFIAGTRAILLVRTANIILAVGWNFALYKYWVYKVEEPKTP
jgi:putative flippase GtrA